MDWLDKVIEEQRKIQGEYVMSLIASIPPGPAWDEPYPIFFDNDFTEEE